MIGKGGFGPVYYGKLEDGQDVAIKELDVKSTQGPSEFFNEVCKSSRLSFVFVMKIVQLGCESKNFNPFNYKTYPKSFLIVYICSKECLILSLHVFGMCYQIIPKCEL
jgi:hypothetical protein